MQKYFISNEELNNNHIISDDINHIKNVMRFKQGDKIIVSNEEDEYLVSLTLLDKKEVKFERIEKLENNNELPFVVDIYQGYPKGDKIQDIIKHGTELGATSIYPTIMKRSVVKLDNTKEESKNLRLRRIAKEAAEQSNRKKITNIGIKLELKKIDFSQYNVKILAYEETAKQGQVSNFKSLIKSVKDNDKVCIIVGPEGGLDLDEVSYLEELGFVPCALGKRILRTETAALYALSAISYELELK